MTVAAVSSVMITLSLVAVFASVILNTAKLANDISNNVRVMVYMRKDVFDNSETIVKEGQTVQNEDYHKVYDALTSMKNVEKVTFSSSSIFNTRLSFFTVNILYPPSLRCDDKR